MTPKQLKQLAAACRKAGIKKYKCGEIEFELADEALLGAHVKAAPAKGAKPAAAPGGTAEIDRTGWDNMTDEQKLFWSAEHAADLIKQ